MTQYKQKRVTEGAPFAFLINLKILSDPLEPAEAELTFSTRLWIVVSAMDSLTTGRMSFAGTWDQYRKEHESGDTTRLIRIPGGAKPVTPIMETVRVTATNNSFLEAIGTATNSMAIFFN